MSTTNLDDYKDLFFTTATEHINQMEQQLRNFDSTSDPSNLASELFRHAHSLKGSSSMMGFSDIAALCDQIDSTIHTGANTFYMEASQIEPLSDYIDKIKSLLENKRNETI